MAGKSLDSGPHLRVIRRQLGHAVGHQPGRRILLHRLERWQCLEEAAPRARTVAYRAALDAIEDDPSEEAEILRLEYRAILMQADDDPNGGITHGRLPADALRLRAIEAARKSIVGLRDTEIIGDDAFHRVEEELDRAELSAGG